MASYTPPRIPRGRNQLGLTIGPPLHAPAAPPVGLRAPAHLFLGAGGGIGATLGATPAVRHPAAAPQPGTPDPYGLLTDAQIAQQAGATVDARINPILKQLADTINARAHAGQAALTSLSQYFAPQLGKLAGIDVAGLQTGIGSQAAIDSAVQQSLTGGGNAAASELGAKLAQISAPDAAGQAAATGALGAGAGNAALASGSAALSALNAQLTSANDMATKEPGIGALYGLQASKDLQAQAARDIADQSGKVTAQVPGLISDLVTAAQNRELTKANANRQQANIDRSFAATEAARGQATKAAGASLAERVREFGISEQNRLKNAGIAAGARVQAAGLAAGSASDRTKESRLKTLIGLKTSNEKSTGVQWQVAPDGSGVRPVDANPRQAGIQTVPTDPAAARDAKAAAASAAAGKPKTVSQWRESIKLTATSGGAYNPKTGAITPELRQAIIDAQVAQGLTPHDPGLKVTPQQAVSAGWAAKPAAPKAPPRVSGTSPSSKYELNPDGSVKGPNPNYVPPKPRAVPVSQTPAGKQAAAAKTKATAIKSANATAQRIVTAGAKRTAVYGNRQVTDPVTLQKSTKYVRTGERYSSDYYKTIHQIEAAVMDTLSPYMPHSQIIKLAQRYANAAYPTPGVGGRPRTAAQIEKAAPTPPRFPKPRGPRPLRKPPAPAHPRSQFEKAFPSPFATP